MSHPYASLPESAFWRTAVADLSLFDIAALWTPRFDIRPEDPVATFGSCFAQHIGRALRARGFSWLDAQPAPHGLSPESARRFNYGVFSARTGNIYTASLLLQWTRWALGERPVPDEVWEAEGRVFDPFRPAIEPGGFASAEELRVNRAAALAAFRACIARARVFVFTLGLTESWTNGPGGYEYPMCPGTVAGRFDPAAHVFRAQGFAEIAAALAAALDLMRGVNPGLRFLLTVSPVPLTATASGQHVMVATMESKSILRAVAAETRRARDDTDYFPSYELIASPAMRGVFFEPNQREVSPRGVAHVMDGFFADLARRFGDHQARAALRARKAPPPDRAGRPDELVCEEELLEAFRT
ncbi:MAG: GSCFA domain-containing protein [Alphaproteobacteria bacterium]|nr:GSCFA domain-containing protein [Alphaproteobacteria bacterium]